MDYHVFVLSRVREAYDRGLSNDEAVAYGIKSTAGVVTSAAVVMVGTFSVFALLPVIDMKEMGIGLAAAILIDATLIRAVLLRDDEAARRPQLVPAELARLAPRLEHGPARGARRPPRRKTILRKREAPPLQPRRGFTVCGAGGGTRTHGLLLTRQLLYQLSYSGRRRTWHSPLVQDPRVFWCARILRLTRWSALSIVLQSQPELVGHLLVGEPSR